MNTDEHRYLEA